MMLTKRGVKNVYALILIMKDQQQDLQNLQNPQNIQNLTHLQDLPLHQRMVVDLLNGLAMVLVMMKITMKFVAGMVETVVVIMLTKRGVKFVYALILIMKDQLQDLQDLQYPQNLQNLTHLQNLPFHQWMVVDLLNGLAM